MLMSQEEQQFLLNHLKPHHRVLEYGSGESTKQIAAKVRSLVSIEHDKDWYSKVLQDSPQNVDLILREPKTPYFWGKCDGTLEQFSNYINTPVGMGVFDVVLIDGRARAYCAAVCSKFSNRNTLIFIHDFNTGEYMRKNYGMAYHYLDEVDYRGSLFLFKLKPHLLEK